MNSFQKNTAWFFCRTIHMQITLSRVQSINADNPLRVDNYKFMKKEPGSTISLIKQFSSKRSVGRLGLINKTVIKRSSSNLKSGFDYIKTKSLKRKIRIVTSSLKSLSRECNFRYLSLQTKTVFYFNTSSCISTIREPQTITLRHWSWLLANN